MAAKNTIEIVIEQQDKATKGINGLIDRLERGFGGLTNTIKKVAAVGAVAGITALVGGLGLAVNEAMEAEQNIAKLEQVIKSTGGAAGVTSGAAQDLASSLAGVTKFSDDTILQGETLLLTFTKIGKDIFPQATESALDMAEIFGSVEAASLQIGKALNDPIQGVGALRRVGVSFTEAQEAQIKAMVESGNIMGAQKLILNELKTEFGGVARAAGATLAGRITIMKNKLLDLAEGIGTSLIPILERGLDVLLVVGEWGADQFTKLYDAAQPVITTFADVFYWLGQAFKAHSAEGGVFAGIVGSLQALFYVYQDGKTTFFSNILQAFGVTQELAQKVGLAIVSVKDAVSGIIERVVTWAQNNQPLLKSIAELVGIVAGLSAVLSVAGTVIGVITAAVAVLLSPVVLIGAAIAALYLAWRNNWLGIGDAVDEAWNRVKPYLDSLYNWFVEDALPQIEAFIRDKAIPAIVEWTRIMVAVWEGIRPTLQQIGDWFLTTALPSIANFITNTAVPAVVDFTNTIVDVWNAVSPTLVKVADWFLTTALPNIRNFILNQFIPGIQSLINIIKNIWDQAQPKLQSFYDFIVDKIGSLKTQVFDPIKNAINDVINTISSMGDTLAGLSSKLPDWMIPGSPTPLELGLRGIKDAMDAVNAQPLFTGVSGAAVGMLGDGSAGGGSNSTTTIQINISESVMRNNPDAKAYGETLAKSLQTQLRFAGGGVTSG